MLGYCRSAVSATVAETPQVEAHMTPYFLFVAAAADRQSMVCRLLADRTVYTHRFETILGKARA